MWGIEFRRETGSSGICAIARFEVRTVDYDNKWSPTIYEEYQVRFVPYGKTGIAIDKMSAEGFVCINKQAEPEDVEAILPTKKDFGKDWSFSEFIIAMTFFGQGYKLGQKDGFRRERKWGRQEV